jgi:hypothetical protein
MAGIELTEEMETMKLQDYKQAIFDHFGVANLEALKQLEEWQALIAQLEITSLRSVSAWETICKAVFLSHQEASVNSSSARPQAKETSALVPTETVTLHPMHNHGGELVGGLVEYSPEQSQQLIEYFKQLSLHSPEPWHQGQLNGAIADQLGVSSALVATGLQAGQLFRVVGPPDLVAKIAAGTHQMIQTAGGSIGTVTATGGGQFVGKLRFANGAAAAMPVLAPLVVYQVLHAIVGTQQLNQINQRLARIEHTLEELHVRQEATILGEIHGAIDTLDDVLASRMNTGLFTVDGIARLATAEKTIRSILERNRLLVDRFRDKTSRVQRKHGKHGARSAAELLKADGPQAVYDMQCLVGLIAADVKLEQAYLLLAIQNNPADVGRRQERIRTKMQTHHETIEQLPSVREIERHAQACLKAMRWWEKLFDFGQTNKTVRAAKKLDLEDIKAPSLAPQTDLNGYVFWRDAEGTHVFSMAGDDLQLAPVGEQSTSHSRKPPPKKATRSRTPKPAPRKATSRRGGR